MKYNSFELKRIKISRIISYAIANVIAIAIAFKILSVIMSGIVIENAIWSLIVGMIGIGIGIVIGIDVILNDLRIKILDSIKSRKNKKSNLLHPSRYKFLKLTEFLFSAKTQKEVFRQVMADWNDEVNEALKKDKDASLIMINVRYTYAFIGAMIQKSPIGDVLEFVVKIALKVAK